MASIKIKYRPSAVVDKPGRIYFQIIQKRITRQVSTPYMVFPGEWDGKRHQIIYNNNVGERSDEIFEIRENVRMDLVRFGRIVRKYEHSSLEYSADDIANEFHRFKTEGSLFSYVERLIAMHKQNGRISAVEKLVVALRSFRKFRKDRDVMLDCINMDMMQAYEGWMSEKGLVANTRSFYMRLLRSIYNRAVDEGIIEDERPFRKVYTGIDRTIKRAIPASKIKRMSQLDLTDNPRLDYARDMFLMSFFLRGMSFVDMSFLRKTDLRNGTIIYRRRKTGQLLTIAWEKEMKQLLKKYTENKTEYLLPIITEQADNKRRAYRNKSAAINRGLKQIAQKLGITTPLTMYVARHSWASAARTEGFPIGVISEGLGHDSESTTRIYLSSLDTAVVDRANSRLIKLIL